MLSMEQHQTANSILALTNIPNILPFAPNEQRADTIKVSRAEVLKWPHAQRGVNLLNTASHAIVEVEVVLVDLNSVNTS